jgi:hypothetical protein
MILLRTRREYVALSGSSAGRSLEVYFNERRLRVFPQNRLCRGVLPVPQEHREYLRGRRRQALRTNLRRAAAAGIRCDVVGDPRIGVDDALEVFHRQWRWVDEAGFQAHLTDVRAYFERPETTVTVARDEQGRPLAVMAAVIDDAVCLIGLAYATSHVARWALHDHLVRILIARRVRYLLAQGGGPFGALGLTANLQHYQHLLGYELRHVIPLSRFAPKRRRRLVASLVVAAATGSIIVSRAEASAPASIAARDAAIKIIANAPVDDRERASFVGVGFGVASRLQDMGAPARRKR